jgi:hypothetical protein
MRWARHVSGTAQTRNEHNILIGKSKGKIQLGRPRRKREGNIKKEFKETG